MKKLFLVGIAATAIFSSCSNEETIEMAQKNAIGFESFVNKSTRNAATDITANNITDFSVYSWQDNTQTLSNEKVDKVINNAETLESGWSYATTQYWAVATYNFYAIAPYNGVGEDTWSYTATSKDAGSINFIAKDGLTDLLYDDLKNVNCTDVTSMLAQSFEFNHILSRVRFGFTESFANENITVVVSNLKINDIQINGTYDGAAWDVNDEKAHYVFDTDAFDGNGDTGFKTTEGAKTYSAHLYMIPCTQTFTITFDVEAFQSGKSIVEKSSKSITVENFLMTQGHSYEFVTDFNSKNVGEEEDSFNAIKFTCNVTGWEENWTETEVETGK